MDQGWKDRVPVRWAGIVRWVFIDRSECDGHRSAAGRLSVLDFEKVVVCIGGMVVKT